MKLLPICVGALALVLAVVASDTAMSTMPLFMWSGNSEVQAKPRNAESALAHALTSKSSPELVMVYLLHEMSTHKMQNAKAEFTHLQDAMEGAKSSTFEALPVSKLTVDKLTATAKVNGVSATEVNSAELQVYLEAHADIMTNSQPEVIVVRFDATAEPAAADALMGAAEKAVAAATSGKYQSILSTTSSMDAGDATSLASKFTQTDLTDYYRYSYKSTTTDRAALLYGPSYMLTPTLLVGVLVMVYMAILALAAYCCILSLQTPELFEGDQEKEMDRAMEKAGQQS